eukprot:TRINITY_DN2428_c0_g1_i1.p3 TRINITY_DN2428_c0_g1~~TRINITY_DN2428_c0_g1_i1.p3  ORF type:complete len:207 (+),score=38.46 TRINITY_DN2428_c0_g1_i1:89-709(+)
MRLSSACLILVLSLISYSAYAERLITEKQLTDILPGTSAKLISEYTPLLEEALKFGEINQCERIAAFIAVVAVESDQLQRLQELGSGSQYEKRCLELGNCQPGDGKKYKGRGVIRVIGRKSYEKIGKDMKIDFEHNPTALGTPKYAFMAGAWYWKGNGLNNFADANDQKSFEAIIKKVNGCLDCAAAQAPRKLQFWKKAKSVLECQ